MKKLLIIITVLLSTLLLSAQEQQVVPYTLADRDRLSSVEAEIKVLSTKISSLENQMNTKFDAVNERIDSLFWMMGIIAAFMIFLLGYTIWDRRTALKPALDSASRTEDKNKNLINALREYARKHPDLAEILKTHGLL
ncbi:MAG: hypothetical protein U5Q03_13960 [Bacteroidota bacterium]|nr:hypothetical protein [Bacteroidota bacterium]